LRLNVLGVELYFTKNSWDKGKDKGKGAIILEEKYDPLQIVSRVWSKFRALPDHRDSKIEDYAIFIEIKNSQKEYYQIRAAKNGFLWRGTESGQTWRSVEDEEELFRARDSLGAVLVRFRERPIKIKGKILDPFPNYTFFWNYIKR
jgi:hypothetical protein